jgi:hypothetical protein
LGSIRCGLLEHRSLVQEVIGIVDSGYIPKESAVAITLFSLDDRDLL